MATMLDNYKNLRQGLDVQMKDSPPSNQVWQYQELLYRIEVLEACQMLQKVAPINADAKALITHYQMVDAYIQGLTSERRYGTASDENIQMQRNTSYQNLCRVIQDYRKRFASFAPSNPDQYRKEIGRAISTVLPAWIQYRNTYVTVNKKEAAQ